MRVVVANLLLLGRSRASSHRIADLGVLNPSGRHGGAGQVRGLATFVPSEELMTRKVGREAKFLEVFELAQVKSIEPALVKAV